MGQSDYGYYLRNLIRSAEWRRCLSLVEGRITSLAAKNDIKDDYHLLSMATEFGVAEPDGKKSRMPRTPTARRKLLLDALSAHSSYAHSEVVESGLRHLQQGFGLGSVEMAILRLDMACDHNGSIDSLADAVMGGVRDLPKALGMLLDVEAGLLRTALSQTGLLVRTGIYSVRNEGSELFGMKGALELSPALFSQLQRDVAGRQEWLDGLIGKPRESELSLDDFSYVGATLTAAAQALSGWFTRRPQGFHIMLVGPVGSGKTDLAATLGRMAGARVLALGEGYDEMEADQPSRDDRIASLRHASYMFSNSPERVVLLADEAEDFLESERAFSATTRATSSKVFLNRILERSTLPVIWTANALDRIEDTVLRRMNAIVQVGAPPEDARERVWTKVLRPHLPDMPAEDIRRLSRRWPTATPGVITNAAIAASLAAEGAKGLDVLVEGLVDALGGHAKPDKGNVDYLPDLVCCDRATLEDLLATARSGARDLSVLAYGPSGSGKSQFGVWLAREMGMPVVSKNASDLLDKYVGGTEKNISAAFAEARAKKAVLIIDEVDTFLLPRGEARQPYMVSTVNQMLTSLEGHDWPVVVTTNELKRLDDASLRRFDYRMCFSAMDDATARRAYRYFFGRDCLLPLVGSLTAGDFANVRRQVRNRVDPDDRLLSSRLAELARQRAGRSPVGFVR